MYQLLIICFSHLFYHILSNLNDFLTKYLIACDPPVYVHDPNNRAAVRAGVKVDRTEPCTVLSITFCLLRATLPILTSFPPFFHLAFIYVMYNG